MPDQFNYPTSIEKSGKSIYDPIGVGEPGLWIPSDALERILGEALAGVSLSGLPLRTRSKVVKTLICKALGYAVPNTFSKTNPRFPGQNFDTYIQKSNNLQVWNEELDPTRRYVLIRVSSSDTISAVRVVNGDVLADYDTTGTLTQKYQARLIRRDHAVELINSEDTPALSSLIAAGGVSLAERLPIEPPTRGLLLPIGTLFQHLSNLVGSTFKDAGVDQERNRGAALHRLVCESLGFSSYADDGRFPDIRQQLLEVKLQTSPTIDLGLVTPDSTAPLDMGIVGGHQIRHCDVRYALFYAEIALGQVVITNVYLTSGNTFFSRFPRFGGKVLNRKLQIPLPQDFF